MFALQGQVQRAVCTSLEVGFKRYSLEKHQ